MSIVVAGTDHDNRTSPRVLEKAGLRLSSEDDLDRTISVLATDFADSYVLSFRPISDQPGYHWIRVQVANPSRRLKVDARSVYWRGEPNAEE